MPLHPPAHVIEIACGAYEIGDDTVPNASPRHCRKLAQTVSVLAYPLPWSYFESYVMDGALRDRECSAGVDAKVDIHLSNALTLCKTAPWKHMNRDLIPLTGVNWFEAAEMAAHFGGRLPTEVEWEIVMKAVSQRNIQLEGYGPLKQQLCELEEWTSDAFAPRYYRADYARSGVPWEPRLKCDISVRGATPDQTHKHLAYRRGVSASELYSRRGFRIAWDRMPSFASAI